jgi:hypothetical protein
LGAVVWRERNANQHGGCRFDVCDAQLEHRLRTGVAPDGKFSPAPASTRFSSYEDFLVTRDAALKKVESDFGIDLSKPPVSGAPDSHEV